MFCQIRVTKHMSIHCLKFCLTAVHLKYDDFLKRNNFCCCFFWMCLCLWFLKFCALHADATHLVILASLSLATVDKMVVPGFVYCFRSLLHLWMSLICCVVWREKKELVMRLQLSVALFDIVTTHNCRKMCERYSLAHAKINQKTLWICAVYFLFFFFWFSQFFFSWTKSFVKSFGFVHLDFCAQAKIPIVFHCISYDNHFYEHFKYTLFHLNKKKVHLS